MTLDYMLYMMEAEGMCDMVDTRTAKINAVIRELIDKNIELNDLVLNDIIDTYELNYLSQDEIDYIEMSICY